MPRNRSRTAKILLALLSVVVGALVSGCATVGPSGQAFYTPPSPLPAGVHGNLIWYRPATVNLGFGSPGQNAWTMLYQSQSVNGQTDAVTGTVIVPTAAWTGSGPRPIVDYGVGSQGLSQASAPSEQLVAGTEYGLDIGDALGKGWAVVITDYAGYTNNSVPDYMVGPSEGHAMLDALTAATQVPGAGVSPSAPVAISGYSQGGGASAWAAQLAPTYTPSANVVGDASGGVPSDLVAVANNLNGSTSAAELLYAIIGLNQDYPTQMNLSNYTNAAGVSAINTALSDDMTSALIAFSGAKIESYTVNNPATGVPWTLAQLLAVPSIASTVAAQSLGGTPITVPVYHYHAASDTIIPLAQDEALNKTYCSEGVKVEFVTYPGDHVTGDAEAASDVINWINDRFNGVAAPSNC